jgi:hypothetical protein
LTDIRRLAEGKVHNRAAAPARLAATVVALLAL